MGIEGPGAAGEGLIALDDETSGQRCEAVLGGHAFDLNPILSGMGSIGLKEARGPVRFVAEKKETFGIGVETSDGVDLGWESAFGQRAVGRSVLGELGEEAPRFVEGDEHGRGWRLGSSGVKRRFQVLACDGRRGD